MAVPSCQKYWRRIQQRIISFPSISSLSVQSGMLAETQIQSVCRLSLTEEHCDCAIRFGWPDSLCGGFVALSSAQKWWNRGRSRRERIITVCRKYQVKEETRGEVRDADKARRRKETWRQRNSQTDGKTDTETENNRHC